MFKENVGLIDPIPAAYVKRLHRLVYEPDYALTCLGVALLRPRIENYSGIIGKYVPFNDELSCVTDFLNHEVQDTPGLYYYTYKHPENNDTAIYDMIRKCGYKVKESIGALLKEKASTKCLAVYHEENNMAAVIVNDSDMRYYHMLISFLPLLFPALFKEKPLEKRDYDILKTLSKTNKDAFIQQIKTSVQPYKEEFTRLMLGDMIRAMHENKIDAARRTVDARRNDVSLAETQYTNTIRAMKQAMIILEGLLATEKYDEPEEDFVEYLSTNKLLHNMKINGNVLSFTVATTLMNYNENAWELFSRRGYIYDGKYGANGRDIELLNVFKDRNNRKILLDNLFSANPEFAVKIAGNYNLDLNSCHIEAERNFDYVAADPMYKSYVPNPHLKIFGCLGGYENRVIRALRDKNYIGAIEMCCASAGSVDLDETQQTFRPFLGWILTSREKILRRTDGVEMTPEEALLYLIDKEKANETNSND